MKEQVKITIKSSTVKPSPFAKGNHKEYRLSLSYNGDGYNFTYHDSVYNWQNNIKLKKEDVLNSILLDASAYEQSKNEKDFLDDFGYNVSDLYESYKSGMSLSMMYDCYGKKDVDNLKAGLKVYRRCKETYNALNRIFTSEELDELHEEFAEY